MDTVSLDEAKRQHPGEWLAFLVTEELPFGEVLGRLIAHNPDRRELHRELRERNVRHAYVTFAGPVIRPGYTAILACASH